MHKSASRCGYCCRAQCVQARRAQAAWRAGHCSSFEMQGHLSSKPALTWWLRDRNPTEEGLHGPAGSSESCRCGIGIVSVFLRSCQW